MRVGSLCTGYGGLDMAVGGDLAWVSDIDKGACALLAHRHPDIPNLGDLKKIDWREVEPVDVLTAGYPCQPFSVAGKQKGIEDERHIWPWIIEGIRILRPARVVLENVPGHLRLGFGDVLGSLAEAGYDAEWCCVRASDVGAPHRRERVFIVASLRHAGHNAGGSELGQQSEGSTGWLVESGQDVATDPDVSRREGTESATRRDVSSRRAHADTAGDGRDEGRTESTGEQGRPHASERGGPAIADWGSYRPAVERWEHKLGRRAPTPTMLGRTGSAVLAPVFVEWMMGLPAGWVTDVPDLSRNQQLKILGNGVVPQQAEYALSQIGL